eukprot:gene10161-8065_t
MSAADDEYDLVTLGAGSGGVRASRFAAANYGAKVLVVEHPFGFVSSETIGGAGGTCVIRGCVPKKLLVYSSQFADEFFDSKGFGWSMSASPTHSWEEMIAHKDKEIQRLNTTYNNILKNAGVEYVEGRGVVVDPHTVEVQIPGGGTRRIRTKNILVAVGAVPTRIPVEGSELAVTSDEALALDSLPQGSIAVLGAGYIATEFAGIFKGMGKEVQLMYRGDKVLRGFDEECRDQVQENLEKRGTQIMPGCNPTKIEKKGDGFTLHYKNAAGEELSMDVGLVMMATGRKPRTYNLGLEAAGVEMDDIGAIKAAGMEMDKLGAMMAS